MVLNFTQLLFLSITFDSNPSHTHTLLLPLHNTSSEIPNPHYSVCAYIQGEEYRGPLFEIPVTVVKPVLVPTPAAGYTNTDTGGPTLELGILSLGPAERHRYVAGWGPVSLELYPRRVLLPC
jgi:hypothetical protein